MWTERLSRRASTVVVVLVVAVAVAVTMAVAVIVGVAVSVLADPEGNEEDAGDVADPAQLREPEVVLREEEDDHDGDGTHEEPEAEEETGGEAVEPAPLVVQRVGGRDRPAVAGFGAVDHAEGDGTDEHRERPVESCEHGVGYAIPRKTGCYVRIGGSCISRSGFASSP